MKLRSYTYKAFLALFFIAIDLAVFAQPPGGPPPGGSPTGGGNPPCWDPACVPIDGGVGFLIAAGAVLGAKKINDHRNKSRA